MLFYREIFVNLLTSWLPRGRFGRGESDIIGDIGTGPLKLNLASKNPLMVDYMQKKDLDEGFNLVYVAKIFIGGNSN